MLSSGEDSKTLMLVHVSPKEEDLCETVCSLNFALRLRSIHLGKTEPNEARLMKETAMKKLQQEMQEIENNRDRFTKEIKKLNQKLGSLTKTSSDSNERLDVLLSSSKVSQQNTEQITITPPSSKMPSFMKPTICSTRRSGMGYQTSYTKDMRPARRKKLPISRAESVNFPIKNMTESCYSGSSISRASCLVGLNETLSEVDKDTEYSHNTENSSINLPEADNLGYLQENKRVLSIPTPEKKCQPKERMQKGKSVDTEMTDIINENGTVISQVLTYETRRLEAYELKYDLDDNIPLFSSVLKDKILILYNSVLLGLGIGSLGFEHDFFQALMS